MTTTSVLDPRADGTAVKRNTSAVIKARSHLYATDTKRLVRALTACSTLACSFRQVKAFSGKQLSEITQFGATANLCHPAELVWRSPGSQRRPST